MTVGRDEHDRLRSTAPGLLFAAGRTQPLDLPHRRVDLQLHDLLAVLGGRARRVPGHAAAVAARSRRSRLDLPLAQTEVDRLFGELPRALTTYFVNG